MFFSLHNKLEVASEKCRQFIHRLMNILWYIVGLDVCCTGNKEQLLVLRSCRFAVTLFGHVERIGNTSCNHQQRLIDKIHSLARIERHKIYQTTFGVLEC